jgi:hypothetical protein
MASKKLKRKYGAVIILDALGASHYTDGQIKEFLSARIEINAIIRNLAKKLTGKGVFASPSIFTFGDTIIITIELRSKKYIENHITGIALLMRRYLFHSLLNKILFRGAFSIGYYIEDSESNTVMGEAVTDAASWYDKFEWMGLSCTPKTNSVLEYHCPHADDDIKFIHKYDVPLKDGKTFKLHTISWPGVFHDKHILRRGEKEDPRKWLLEILKDFHIPIGAETKIENTKKYFTFVEKELAKRELKASTKGKS